MIFYLYLVYLNNQIYLIDIYHTHYSENLNNYPIDKSLNSKQDLVKWLIDIHNEVNVKNNKRKYSYDEVINKYNNLYSPKTNYCMIIIIILLILFAIYFLRKIIKEIK